jgi:NCS1 family nucleobase:cation symporter-1
VAALLFVDFFFVRKQKLALRSALDLPGYNAYKYTRGFNWIGFFCIAAGIAMSLSIYNPITAQVHNMFLFHLTPTGFSFLGTGILYYLLSWIPPFRKYLLCDRNEITI